MSNVYRWKIPTLAAEQFDGKNYATIKALVGDTSDDKEKIHVSHFPPKYEEKEIEDAEPIEVPVEPAPKDPHAPKTKKVQPKEQVEKKEELKVKKGDWVTKNVANGKVEVNPEGFPDSYEQL